MGKAEDVEREQRERDDAAIAEARAYGIDIGLINSLLDLPVIERLRRNDADAELDSVLRERADEAASG